ncbi:MAG: CRISPR-associated endonuclease Cas2 [Patescibacteria group bacterium]|nr:CRISPR-associated endonuclease Cas2 [Patescibacteria group bacterium]MBU2508996.1 CRISPR-associated endonuclease Cas2 [Patescibacteria group bacterium]
MKRKTKDKIRNLSTMLYDVLGTGALVTVVGLLSQGRTADKLFKCFAGYSVWRIKQMLREQKLLGYIEYDEEDEHSRICLTNKGFTRTAKNKLQNVKAIKWDYFWRLVCFDIPEKNGSRRKFQRMLKNSGFFRLQKSLYVYPHDCKTEVLSLASSIRASSYVDVYTVPNLGRREQEVRKFYLYRQLETK